ncbi:MAG: DUF177 domain-containing protein [Cardiobacteriaceae bacterium]|nr:DUF177 domain-containing protein [Cardiobacteriaceae bacterium]
MTLKNVESMMRPPANSSPKLIDPWLYAQNHCHENGLLYLDETNTLREWMKMRDEVIHYTLEGSIDKHGQHRLSGHIHVNLHTTCQRCLEEMMLNIMHSFNYVLIRDQSFEDNVTDSNETLICAEEQLDLAWFIEEEVLLAMPMIAKHEDCNPPQIDLQESDLQTEKTSPFAALKNIITAKENPHGRSTKS